MEKLQSFIHSWYRPIFVIGVIGVVGLSYYIGFSEGKAESSSKVALNCPDTLLESLKIPTMALARGGSSTAKSDTVAASDQAPIAPAQSAEGKYVGSKNGKKYYTAGCSGTKRIKPANLIYFKDAQDAQLQGYSKGSC